jgi:hypothetical protein
MTVSNTEVNTDRTLPLPETVLTTYEELAHMASQQFHEEGTS